MDRWKIVVVLALLGALSAYGYYQQNAENTPPPPPEETEQAAQSDPDENLGPQLSDLTGQTPPAWNIAADRWVNTPDPISLESLKGSVALLEFWRIGCRHCEETVPFLNEVHKQYEPKGLKIVTFHSPGVLGPENPENDWEHVRQTIEEWKITYPVAFDEGGQLFKESYGGNTYPTLIVLNRDGTVRSVGTGHTPQKEQELIAILDEALAGEKQTGPASEQEPEPAKTE